MIICVVRLDFGVTLNFSGILFSISVIDSKFSNSIFDKFGQNSVLFCLDPFLEPFWTHIHKTMNMDMDFNFVEKFSNLDIGLVEFIPNTPNSHPNCNQHMRIDI